MKAAENHSQCFQRIKVGVIGLVAVVLLIGLASAIIGSATRSGRASNIAVETAANASSVNMADGGAEPLAQLGAAPGPDPAATSRTIATR